MKLILLFFGAAALAPGVCVFAVYVMSAIGRRLARIIDAEASR